MSATRPLVSIASSTTTTAAAASHASTLSTTPSPPQTPPPSTLVNPARLDRLFFPFLSPVFAPLRVFIFLIPPLTLISRNSLNNITNLVAGGSAGVVSSVITCPLEVVKTRLQNRAAEHRHYKGTTSKSTPSPSLCPPFPLSFLNDPP